MFGFLNRLRGTETRSSEIDVGSLYASFFQFGGGSYSWAQSPAILVSSLSVLDNSGAILTQSRRLGRTSPLLIAYRAIIETGLLTGAAEAPELPDTVPEAVAEAVADLWIDAHDCDRERDLLDRLVTDGEFLELDDGTIVPPDGFEPIMAGPKWNREVVGYQDRHGLTRPHGGPALHRRSPHGREPRLAVDRPGASPGGWPVEREDRGRACARHHGENRQRDREREP